MSLAGTGSVHSVLMCIVMVEKIYHRMKLFFFSTIMLKSTLPNA